MKQDFAQIGMTEQSLERRERLLNRQASSRQSNAIEENLRRLREAEYPTRVNQYRHH